MSQDNQQLSSMGIDADKAFGVEFGRYDNLNVFCPWCEDPEESQSPSCSVSRHGAFTCKACGRAGSAPEFYATVHNVSIANAHRLIKESATSAQARAKKIKKANSSSKKKVAPLTMKVVDKCRNTLLRSTVMLGYLTDRRGLTVDTIKDFFIGCDEHRITFPVLDGDSNLVDMRRYLPDRKNKLMPKIVSHEGGQGGAYLYPMWRMDLYRESDEEYIVLCEGELDTALLHQNGFNPLTVTSGVSTWHSEFTEHLMAIGKSIVIIYDVNDKDADLGQRIAWDRARILHDVGLEVKVVRLPLPEKYIGGDVTNWFVDERRTAEELRELIEDTPWFDESMLMPAPQDKHPDRSVDPSPDSTSPLITLYDASHSKYFYEKIRLRCLVAGRGMAPFLLPTKLQIEYQVEDGQTETVEKEFDAWDGVILSMINCSTTAQKRFLRTLMGLPSNCPMSVTVLESTNVEELHLIPAVDSENDGGPYVMRQAFYVGHGLQHNQVYEFEGYTLPDPRTQAATHILTKAVPADTDLDQPELDDDTIESLRHSFSTVNPHDKLEEIARHHAVHVSKIYGRDDLHIAVDLVMHSCLVFDFNGTRLRKGWLECLIMGDTRTGKGFATEGLAKYYGVGEVVSGENLTFAGLIGGIFKAGDTNTLVWGKIPLADRRLIIMDECSSLSQKIISELSRIRSEGVAEVTKIISEKTTARTRLIWLANPRATVSGTPKMIRDFTFGIESVPEMIGAAEDVARFDYVLIVSQNEVPSSLINKEAKVTESPDPRYSPELCRKLIVWAWSRKPEQIKFEDGVEAFALQAAQELGRHFSPKFCLIQSEDVRFKIARIAVAAAARTFSSPDGVNLIVKQEHVEFAYNFLYSIYSKPCCGYLQMSMAEKERSTLRNPKEVYTILGKAGPLMPDLVDGLLEHRHLTARDMCDYAGMDIFQARDIVSELVRGRAITKEHQYYIKKPAFKTFLQELKSRLVTDPNLTEWTEELEDDYVAEQFQYNDDDTDGDISGADEADGDSGANGGSGETVQPSGSGNGQVDDSVANNRDADVWEQAKDGR